MLYIIYTSSIYLGKITSFLRGDLMLKKRIREEENSEDDINIYSREVRESLLDDDELSPIEEAFMSGYEDAG